MMRREIMVFAKTPRSGAVKTRLAPALGRHGALRAYRTLLHTTLNMVAVAQEALAATVTVWHAPVRFEHPFIGRAQPRGDLGARMRYAFAGQRGVALAIGTDCPSLSLAHLDQAFAALTDADVVFGPALDGGYYLIGLKQRAPRLFQGIDWSTSKVLGQSLRRAQRLGLKTALLPTLSDVDSPRDWRGLAFVH